MTLRSFASRAVLGALLVLPAIAGAQTRTPSLSDKGVPLDRIAAVVNEGVVLQSDLEDQMLLHRLQSAHPLRWIGGELE